MDARAINAALRKGDELSPAEMNWFAHGLADGRVSAAQAGGRLRWAFVYADCLNQRVSR